jgi:hypothetical protein
MIKKIISRYKKNQSIESLLKNLHEISTRSTIINLCAEPTGYSWLGVYNAGLSLFPENTLAIPQYYSNQVLTNSQLEEIGTEIGKLKFQQIIYNGYNDYFSYISKAALKKVPSIRVGVINHGFFAEFSGNDVQNAILRSLLEEIKEKRIHKMGFLKQGNSEIFNKLFGVPSFLIVNKNPQPILGVETLPTIGVLTNQSFRKNTATQVIAALSLKDYYVSIFDSTEYDPFDVHHKLEKNTHLSHAEFLTKLGKNILNSHVTFSEASGGQVFTESLAVGVPCLTSLTHGYLNDSAELHKALVVERFDDAWAIAQKMEEVIGNRDHLSKLGLIYSEQMNLKADELLNIFLEA